MVYHCNCGISGFASLLLISYRVGDGALSGDTSYGKLAPFHITNPLLPVVDAAARTAVARTVRDWTLTVEKGLEIWGMIGSEEDRMPIVNSPVVGLSLMMIRATLS